MTGRAKRIATEPEQDALRRAEADHQRAYAALRGWNKSGQFFLTTLANGLMHDGSQWVDSVRRAAPLPLVDHASYWRLDGYPVAVACHCYDFGPNECVITEAWAACHGLALAFPTDFPSWWCPGLTTLIEVRRAP